MEDYKNKLSINENINLTSGLTNVIHAGLPWSNPLKLQIGSNEHIIDTTINRGLMMLLNNDYYLDVKQDLLSENLSSVIARSKDLEYVLNAHIHDDSMHFKESVNVTYNTTNNYSFNQGESGINEDVLQENTVKYLSIGWDLNKIQHEIDNTPHNLNGLTLAFIFVVPSDYTADDYRYVLDIENNFISFNNFINGKLIIFGDMLHKSEYLNSNSVNKKFPEQIENPAKYDKLNTNKFIMNFSNEVDRPEQINDIIKYESYDKSFFEDVEGQRDANLNKIIIKGTSLNSEYSLFTFNDNQAYIIVKNICFESSLPATKNVVDIMKLNLYNLPYSECVSIFYQLKDNCDAVLNEEFKNEIQLNSVIPEINTNLNAFMTNINDALNKLENTDVYNQYIANSDLSKSKIIVHNDGTACSGLIDVCTELGNYINTSGCLENVKKQMKLNTSNAVEIISIASSLIRNLINDIKVVNASKLTPSAEYYIDKNTTKFNSTKFIDDASEYVFLNGIILSGVSELSGSTSLQTIIMSDEEMLPLSGSTTDKYNKFVSDNFGIYVNELNNSINGINKDVIIKLPNLLTTFNAESLNIIKNGASILNSEGAVLLNSTMSIPSGAYTNDLQTSLFSDSIHTYIEGNGLTGFNSSNTGSTIFIWTKPLNNFFADGSIIKFEFTDDEYISISPRKIMTNLNGSKTLNVSIMSDNEITSAMTTNEWLLWEIKFDTTSHDKLGVSVFMHYKNNENKHISSNIKYNDEKETYIEFKNSEHNLSNIIFGADLSSDSTTNMDIIYNAIFRNILFVAGHVTSERCEGLYFNGIKSSYVLKSQYDLSDIREMLDSGNFFLGLVGSYNNNNINILNCIFKHNGKSYTLSREK